MLRGLWAFFVLVVATVAVGLPATLVSLVHRRSNITNRAARVWSWAMLRATGARVTYVDLENCRQPSPCIYIANHQSNVDIWALFRVLPLSARFVAKQSLFRVPVLGWAMAASGFISIDRSNRHKAIQSLRLAAERIRAGTSLILFPEGTRSRDGRLQPFKKGPFHLALQAGVPVVPVAIRGSYDVLRPGTWRVRPGPVEVRFLPPLDVAPFRPGDHKGLAVEVERTIATALGELPAERPRTPSSEAE